MPKWLFCFFFILDLHPSSEHYDIRAPDFDPERWGEIPGHIIPKQVKISFQGVDERMRMLNKGFCLLAAILSVCCILSPVGAADDPALFLQEGEPVPEQFVFSGEPPSLEEIKEAFENIFGPDPSLWPDELRHIHEVQVAFNRRALESSKFKGQFSKESLEKIKAQSEDPVLYWSRCLHEGWGYEEWFNNEHLTVQRVPRAMLERFLREVFPITWRDIRSMVHLKEYMLGLPEKKFVPYNKYDSQVLGLRKKDLQEYNSLIESAAERYIENNDYLMLLLMPARIDTNWVDDARFEASLLEKAGKLSEKVQNVVNDMDRGFRELFYEAVPRLTYSWNEQSWSENHVVFSGKPVSESPNVDLLGRSTRIEHPYIGEKITIQEQKVITGSAMKLQWGTDPSHSSEFDQGAIIVKVSPRYMIAVKQYDGSKEFILSLYLDHVSGFGHEVSFGPADGPPYSGQIGEEMMDAITGAFFEAAEVLYGGAPRRAPVPQPKSGGQTEEEKPADTSPARKMEITPSRAENMHVACELPASCTFVLRVREGRELVPHAEIAIRKPEIGTLSSKTATGGDEDWLMLKTGPLGEAELTYTPPSLSEMNRLGPLQWDIRITAEETGTGEKGSVSFRITRPKGMEVTLGHKILPADPDFSNPVRLRFDGRGPGSDPSEKFRVMITVKSGKGVLSTQEELGGRSSFAMEVEADREHLLHYRWFGERQLQGPVTETLVFKVPELEIEGEATFSVGVAPSIDSPQQDRMGVEQPGLFVPLKVYVQDEYHPDLDMAEFFRAFKLKPVLDISQVGFEPIDPDDSAGTQILNSILEHVRGAELPRDALSVEPETWSLARDAGSRWFLVSGTPAGGASPGAFPGIILWEYGDYTFRISMNLEDAQGVLVEPLKRTMTKILHVRPFTSSSDGKADLVLPMILAFSAIFPGEEARQFAARSRNLLQRNDFETAAVSIGEQFARRLSQVSLSEVADPVQRQRLEYLINKAHGLVGATLSERVLNESLSQAKQNFLCAVAGIYAEVFLSGGYDLSRLVDAPSLDRNSPEMQVLELIKGFLEGFGEYGIVALTRENIQSLEVFSESGEKLSESPGQVFGGGDISRRVFFGNNSVVIPFRLGENLLINLRGKGKPVDAIKILPNGINVQRYGFRPGTETINVFGDVVRP